MSVEQSSDLYGLPLDEFTQARNGLADRLKSDGDASEAKRVRALKKPSLPAWTVNQLARKHEDRIEELFRLRDEIETASDASMLRAKTEERRRLLTRLVSDARRILAEGGHAPSASTIEKVSQTLLAAGEEDTKQLVLEGTLERELTATTSSFGAFGSFDAASVEFDNEPDAPDPRLERLTAEADEADREAEALEGEAEQAERDAARARDRAAEARRRAIKARDKASRAAER